MAKGDADKRTPRKAAGGAPPTATQPRGQAPEACGLQHADAAAQVKISSVANPLLQATLGELGPASEVTGPPQFPPTILVQPYDPQQLRGLDPISIRVFRADKSGAQPVWN